MRVRGYKSLLNMFLIVTEASGLGSPGCKVGLEMGSPG